MPTRIRLPRVSPLTHAAGAFFTTYEGAKHVLSERTALPSPLAHAGASALAELVSCAILTPAEVIKQNAQMVSRPSAGAASATTQVLQRFRTNPLALWRGYGALASRNLPFTAMQFPMFEKFREQLEAWRQRATGPRRKQDVSVWENGVITAAAAGSAGAIAAVVTTPIDVVKTRIMLAAATSLAEPTSAPAAVQAVQEGKVVDALGSLSGSTGGKAESRKLSSWAIGQDVVAHEGWKGLWRGGALRGAWTLLGSGLYLGVYESGRVFLERRRQEQQQEE